MQKKKLKKIINKFIHIYLHNNREWRDKNMTYGYKEKNNRTEDKFSEKVRSVNEPLITNKAIIKKICL